MVSGFYIHYRYSRENEQLKSKISIIDIQPVYITTDDDTICLNIKIL